MYFPKTVKKTESGAASPAKPNVTFLRADDVLGNIVRDGNGVRILGDIVPKPGAKMIQVYMTPSKQEKNYASDGDEDQETITQTFVGWHPGDSLDINEFVQNNLGVGYIIIADNCTDGNMRVYGTLCSPMKLNVEKTNDESGNGVQMTFEQAVGTKFVPGFYSGSLAFAEPHSTDEDLNLTVANGSQYLLDASAAGEALDVVSIDIPHGETVTLIGQGGTTPMKLENGASTAATVILKDGTQWNALKDATITLRVFDDGATIYLIEENRS